MNKEITKDQAIDEGWFRENSNGGLCECEECGLPAPISQSTNKRCGHLKGEPRHFRAGHNTRKKYVKERAWARAEARTFFDDELQRNRLFPLIEISESGCWLWKGRIDPRTGYGFTTCNGVTEPAHRVSYRLFVGDLHSDWEVDHVCHTLDLSCPPDNTCCHRRCVNPFHLELVPRAENLRRSQCPVGINDRKTRCIRGHEFDEENTYVTPKGDRQCRKCRAEAERVGRKRRSKKNQLTQPGSQT